MGQSSVAVLGGGCFWCLEAVFDNLKGVHEVVSGYCGGHVDAPSYEAVCGGDTGHAEVVRITFDPEVITFSALLDVFFTIHDPTTPNRQGNDVGPQYRSVIFCQDDAQRADAVAAIGRAAAAGLWDGPVVTELADAAPFWPAEDYHRAYYRQHGEQPYCLLVVAPKVAKARKRFAVLQKH